MADGTLLLLPAVHLCFPTYVLIIDKINIHKRNLLIFVYIFPLKVECPVPNNGTLSCPNGDTTGVFEDACTFLCDVGYELQGPSNGTCLADQSWSEGDPICVELNCSTSPPVDNSQLELPCDTQYWSTCTTVCVDGYTGGGGSYTCVVTDVATNNVGWNGSTNCERGKFNIFKL